MYLFYKQNRRKISKKKVFLTILKIFPFVIFFFFIIWLALQQKSTQLNIEWDIEQQPYISQQTLEKKIKPLITNKYILKLAKIKQVLEQEPWIKNAHIRRTSWNDIKIQITIQQIEVRLQKQGKNNGYISTTGELFFPKEIINSNAVVINSNKDQPNISLLYQDYKHYQSLVEPMTIVAINKTNIDKLTIKPNIKKPNIDVILGHQMQDERLLRFIKVYKKLKQAKKRIGQGAIFDMRYHRGFSLSYQK